MKQKNDGGPAFGHGNPKDGGAPGLSLREYAAIQLRVPRSGIEWLDDMIRDARRMDYTGQAMTGIASIANEGFIISPEDEAAWAEQRANALLGNPMLAAREKGGDA